MAQPLAREHAFPDRRHIESASDILRQASAIMIMDTPLIRLAEKYPGTISGLMKGRHKPGSGRGITSAYIKTLITSGPRRTS